MIIDLPATTTTAVAKKLIKLRQEGGAVTLGRVLTLVIVTDTSSTTEAIDAANVASREHPCRIIVLATGSTEKGIDAEIRIGGDAGASEVIILTAPAEALVHADTLVMPLLLPDAPIVAWWPREAPANPGADVIGAMAHRRITDSYRSADPRASIRRLAEAYRPGDTDLAWTRTTIWRGLLASTLDQPPFEPVLRATVAGQDDHSSLDLLAAWLGEELDCEVDVVRTPGAQAVTSVTLTRASGDITLARPSGKVAILSQPQQPDHRIALPVRQLHECIAEELRRLDEDEMYGEVLTQGLRRVAS
ncbi:glucose-6-phosphate dehydrogenase assembly protein OpcA [Flavimobilis sp. GY10621]|uniref:Glucose-6-phosphate dehydrogenase assembly protein OpcA n=1 Tax=Flavimobilis rhizosphaerae TaxID=2775421 RepID=A0ABR9DRY3_9MICO|nr:glucose-6-phosphate dehydrogenase assembly protein OpcA [Flavimobilis rhizosphaerae]MBD9699892.1 glucose-6-phosphate dehydrogenase assembly protein OpcA [Flavimobilis rhizosphaerae]